jgi:hypothetical protein
MQSPYHCTRASGAWTLNLSLTIEEADFSGSIMGNRLYTYSSGAECIDKCKNTQGCKMATWSMYSRYCRLKSVVDYTTMFRSSGSYAYVPGTLKSTKCCVRRLAVTQNLNLSCMCRCRQSIQGSRSQARRNGAAD